MTDTSTPKRPATGAAQLREHVTDAITTAVLDELAESGYARMSMEAVATRAGVGKAAIYRRWSSKQPMVEQIVSGLTWDAVPVPDTGSLAGDVRSFLAHASALQRDPRTTRIIADLGAEAARNPRLAQAFYTALREPRRAAGTAMLRRAVERGELPPDLDTELALDCLVALAYARPRRPEWQEPSATEETSDTEPDSGDTDRRLVRVILTTLAACSR